MSQSTPRDELDQPAPGHWPRDFDIRQAYAEQQELLDPHFAKQALNSQKTAPQGGYRGEPLDAIRLARPAADRGDRE